MEQQEEKMKIEERQKTVTERLKFNVTDEWFLLSK